MELPRGVLRATFQKKLSLLNNKLFLCKKDICTTVLFCTQRKPLNGCVISVVPYFILSIFIS